LKMAKFYNAQINYESNLKGLFGYFEQKNALYYLCDTPQILKDMEMISSTTRYGNQSKGSRANTEVNKWARLLQADYMLSRVNEKSEEDLRLKMHTIRSLAYLEEAIKWNPDGNFDRISAMGMLMILREERYKRTRIAKENMGKKTNLLANDPFFNNNYSNDDFLYTQ